MYPAFYRFTCYPPREGNLEDAIYAAGFKGGEDEMEEVEEQQEPDAQESLRNDNEEQLEDAEELAAVEREMEVNIIETLKATRLEDAEAAQTATQLEPEVKGGKAPVSLKEDLLAVPESATKSPTLARKKSKRELKPLPKWRP